MDKITAWRITSEKHADAAFDGEGAEEYGGRFNSVGTPAVYTSESVSLATLELLAKAGGRQRLSGQVVLPVTFGESRAVAYDEKDLPEGWDARPYGPASQQVGGEWAWSEESLVLRVPSVVVPMEYNYLINPKHPDFGELEFGEPRPLDPNPRLPVE